MIDLGRLPALLDGSVCLEVLKDSRRLGQAVEPIDQLRQRCTQGGPLRENNVIQVPRRTCFAEMSLSTPRWDGL